MNKLITLLLVTTALHAQDVRGIIEEVQRRSHTDSQRYEGTLQVIDNKERVTTKRWTYQRIGSFGESKAVLKFIEPAEVKGIALLIFNQKDRSSDQWMWTPSLQRDRRIAMQDRSTRFFGTDFSFEDLEERDVDQFDYKLLGEEPLNGQACWKIESRPRKTKSSQYTHSHVWVRKDIYAFVQIEGFKNQTLVRRIQYSNFEKIKNIWTAKKFEVLDAARKSRTVMQLEKLEYNIPTKQEDFTLQSLRRSE